MKTREDIIQLFQKHDIPTDVVFCADTNMLSWVAFEIINTRFKDMFEFEVMKYNFFDFQNSLMPLKDNKSIIAYFYNMRTNDIFILCDDETKTAIEMCGGLQQFITLGD